MLNEVCRVSNAPLSTTYTASSESALHPTKRACPRAHCRIPIRLRVTGGALGRRPKRRMPAFRHEHDFRAPLGNRLADQRLAIGITFGGVDHVDPGIERGVQNFIDSLLRDRLVANLGTAKSEDADSKP